MFTVRPGKNSTWTNGFNHGHLKELSKVVDKMQVVPLGPKRVKLSQIKDYKVIGNMFNLKLIIKEQKQYKKKKLKN